MSSVCKHRNVKVTDRVPSVSRLQTSHLVRGLQQLSKLLVGGKGVGFFFFSTFYFVVSRMITPLSTYGDCDNLFPMETPLIHWLFIFTKRFLSSRQGRSTWLSSTSYSRGTLRVVFWRSIPWRPTVRPMGWLKILLYCLISVNEQLSPFLMCVFHRIRQDPRYCFIVWPVKYSLSLNKKCQTSDPTSSTVF